MAKHSVEDDGSVTAESRGILFRVTANALRAEGDAALGPDRAPGDTCRVRVPKESLRLVPGYYLARGDAEPAPHVPGSHVVRLYWHLRPEGAAPWVAALTAGLNRSGIPFHLKVLRNPRVYRRADAGVLYLDPAVYETASGEIKRAWREVRGALRPEVPMLTARLAAGLGAADGPGDRSSFGEHRCGLIAEALVGAFEQGRRSRDERGKAVAETFRAAGLDPIRPHLEPGSNTRYKTLDAARTGVSQRPRVAQCLAKRSLAKRSPAKRSPVISLLEGARTIGDVLCREAFWHDGRCTWVGYSRRVAVATLGADLYRGVAGVGLFLAELHAVTGDPVHRKTALAALGQALAKLDQDAERYRPLAFYDGRLGVAWAAHRVAALSGDSGLESRAGALLRTLGARPGEGRRIDLFCGNAGAILAALDLGLRDTALVLGEELCQAGVRRGAAWWWENDSNSGLDPSAAPLTGLAHGSAGIGLALLGLFAASGRQTFLDAATGAFAYEDALFDSRRGNWPDLRGPSHAESPDAEKKFMTAWCHGAPGIALSRLYAMAIDPSRASLYETTARVALETTQRALDQGLAGEDADTSLCHGLCGMIDILLISAEILEETAPRRAAMEALRCLVDRHGQCGDWPSGVTSRGRNPSLFLGEAGVGYTLLRLSASPQPPSVLMAGAAGSWRL